MLGFIILKTYAINVFYFMPKSVRKSLFSDVKISVNFVQMEFLIYLYARQV
jgi:hypothetical protein